MNDRQAKNQSMNRSILCPLIETLVAVARYEHEIWCFFNTEELPLTNTNTNGCYEIILCRTDVSRIWHGVALPLAVLHGGLFTFYE